MSRRARLALIVGSAIFQAWPAIRLARSPWRGEIAFRCAAQSELPGAPAAAVAPGRRDGFASPDSPGVSVHAGSIAELPDGTLAAAWYAGSREGAPDVRILMARRPAGPLADWGPPRELVSRESASRELGRYVRKVGNAVIFADDSGRLWLVYVTIAIGGWSGSSLNVKGSTDGGETWTPSRRLALSPFFNLSELVRSQPVPLEGGGFALPIYHENMAKFPEILWLAGPPGGALSWRKSRISWGRSFIQPAIAPLGPREAVALLRTCAGERAVGAAWTSDACASWSPVRRLEGLPNPDAAVGAVALPGGRLLLAFNDSVSDRSNLKLAVSSDCGASWLRIATLEEEGGAEFSYPFMIRSRGGRIHLVYTWRRRRIRHVEFDDSWLEERVRAALGGQAR